MTRIRPSPAIVVRADTPIQEVVRRMREAKVGSILVTRSSAPFDLMGIFTERDLLNRLDELIQGQHWDKSIATIMTHPVYTLPILGIDQAADRMIEKNVRHLPVVYEDERQQSHLVGVVSMRDLFRDLVGDLRGGLGHDSTRAVVGAVSSPFSLSLLTDDPATIALLPQVLAQSSGVQLQTHSLRALLAAEKWRENPLPSELQCAVCVLDLDFESTSGWALLLKQLCDSADHPIALPGVARPRPGIVVLFTPGRHEAKNVAVLEELARGGALHAFAKPLNLIDFLQTIGRLGRPASP